MCRFAAANEALPEEVDRKTAKTRSTAALFDDILFQSYFILPLCRFKMPGWEMPHIDGNPA
jgi:hypothetical protein